MDSNFMYGLWGLQIESKAKEQIEDIEKGCEEAMRETMDKHYVKHIVESFDDE